MITQVERELALIQAYVAAERERCAKIAEGLAECAGSQSWIDACRAIADDIRNPNK